MVMDLSAELDFLMIPPISQQKWYHTKPPHKQLKIDEQDHFGLLLATAAYDTIGAVTVKPEK